MVVDNSKSMQQRQKEKEGSLSTDAISKREHLMAVIAAFIGLSTSLVYNLNEEEKNQFQKIHNRSILDGDAIILALEITQRNEHKIDVHHNHN